MRESIQVSEISTSEKLQKAKEALLKKEKKKIKAKAERLLIRKGDVEVYRKVIFDEVYKKAIKFAWFDAFLAQILFNIIFGDEKRVIISMPPRYGKTEWCVRLFVSILQGLVNQAKVQYVTYGDTLSTRTSVEIKDIMESEAYRYIFPATKFNPKQNQKDNWKLQTWGEYFATSIGGAVTGIGSNYTVIDDPLKAADGDSPAKLKEVVDFYKSSVVTRLEDDGAILVIMQRLAEDDLVGWLTKEHGIKKVIGKAVDGSTSYKESADGVWTLLVLPALSDVDIVYEYEDLVYNRPANEPLNENQHTYEQLMALQKDMSKKEFQKQYNQNPENSEAGTFHKEDITYISEFDFPEMEKYISVDRAESISDGADDRSISVVGWSIDEKEVERQVLIDGRFGKWDIYGLVESIISLMLKNRDASVWIEEPKGGFVSTVLKAEILKVNAKLRAEGKRQLTNPIHTYTPPTNRTKQHKISLGIQPIEQHLWKVSKSCDSGFLEQWKKELLRFDPMKRNQIDNCIDASFSTFLFATPKRVQSGERVVTKRVKRHKEAKTWRGIG